VNENRPLPSHPNHCDYCATALDPSLSLCARCAKPYKGGSLALPLVDLDPYEDDEVRIRKRAPQAINLFFWFLSVLLLSSTVAAAVFSNEEGIHAEIFVQGALILTTIVFAAIHFPSLAVQLKVPGIFTQHFVAGLGMLIVLLGVNYFYHFVIMDSLFESLGIGDRDYREIFPSFAGLVLFLCIIPGIMEEITFRGLIQHWLHTVVSPSKAIIVASAMFAAAHFSPLSAPYLFAVELVLGWLRWKTGSLYSSMIIHFLHNFKVILLIEAT
jgi:hypothetical protein